MQLAWRSEVSRVGCTEVIYIYIERERERDLTRQIAAIVLLLLQMMMMMMIQSHIDPTVRSHAFSQPLPVYMYRLD